MNVRNMGLVAAAAAMIAMAPSMTRAQDNSVNTTNSGTSATTTTTSTTETTTEFVPINLPNIAPPPTGPNGEPINYTVLAGKSYDYMDLNQAHAEGFSDHDIAVIAKIADKSGMPFDAIKHMALDGQAYPTIANRYNLRLADVLDASDYESQIANYRVAYETTGANAVKNLVAGYQEQYGTAPYASTSATTTVVSPNASLADVVNSSPELTMFARALRTAGMMNVLNGSGPLTIFAPTDAAFAKLSSDQVNALMNNKSELVQVLDYAIVSQNVPTSNFSTMTSPITTLNGSTLQLTTSGSNLMVNGANVVKPDIQARNGVIQEVDTVLLPANVTTITTTTTNTTTTNENTTTGTGTGGSEGGTTTVTPTEPGTAPNPTTEPGNTTNP